MSSVVNFTHKVLCKNGLTIAMSLCQYLTTLHECYSILSSIFSINPKYVGRKSISGLYLCFPSHGNPLYLSFAGTENQQLLSLPVQTAVPFSAGAAARLTGVRVEYLQVILYRA